MNIGVTCGFRELFSGIKTGTEDDILFPGIKKGLTGFLAVHDETAFVFLAMRIISHAVSRGSVLVASERNPRMVRKAFGRALGMTGENVSSSKIRISFHFSGDVTDLGFLPFVRKEGTDIVVRDMVGVIPAKPRFLYSRFSRKAAAAGCASLVVRTEPDMDPEWKDFAERSDWCGSLSAFGGLSAPGEGGVELVIRKNLFSRSSRIISRSFGATSRKQASFNGISQNA